MTSRIGKLDGIRKAKNIDAFLLTSAASVKYFSGYFFYFEHGTSPFQLLPAALIIGQVQKPMLVLADNETGQLPSIDPGVVVKTYESYVYKKPIDFTEQFLIRMHEAIKESGVSSGRVGVEFNSLPYSVVQSIISLYPSIQLIDVADEIATIRLIKDQDEIECIRRSAHLSDIGQAAVLRMAEAGMTELELFDLIRQEMEASVGTRVPLMADFVSGESTASGGGLPTNRIIQSGDLVLSDFTPCLNGYWGDSCSTTVVDGTPDSEQSRIFTLVEEALDIGIRSIRPGVQAKEVDAAMRRHLEAEGGFDHHGGHGVGILYHEEPRIVPYNNMVLQPGMVIALEPAVYKKDFGIRLEHLMVVTDDGCEILTKFRHSFLQD